jgi:hypothetical protein
MQEEVLCAEQWLWAHASTKANGWKIVGPLAEVPPPQQLHAVGDTVFAWDSAYPLGGFGENKNTDHALRLGTIEPIALGMDLPH